MMQQTVDVQVCRSDALDDVTVVIHHEDVTVADVFEALGVRGEDAVINGHRITSPATTPATGLITAGSRLGTVKDASSQGGLALGSARESETPRLEVTVVAGLDAGAVVSLPPGLHQVTPDASGHDPGWYVDVSDDAGASGPWHRTGSSIEAMVTAGGALGLGLPVDVEPGHGPIIHRPPRHVPPGDLEPVELADPPPPVKPRSKLSWVTLLTPIPIALLMAFFFRPIFALFAAMGPVMAIGRWYESKRRFQRESATRQQAVAVMTTAVSAEVTQYCELEAQRRWLSHPHVGELWRRSRCWSVRLWERRPGAPGFLELAVGIAPDAVEVVTAGATPDAEVHAAALQSATIRAVPHTIDLVANQGVGIYGERVAALAMARAFVLQLATLHGPADLTLGLLASPQTIGDWDWLKWLPHRDATLTATSAKPLTSALAVAKTPATGSTSFGLESSEELRSVDLVIVDAGHCDVAALQRVASESGRHVRFVAIAAHSTRLPAACSSLIAASTLVAELATPELDGRRQSVVPIGVGEATATAWARSMASLVDPEVVGAQSESEDAVSLLALLGFTDSEAIRTRWDARPIDDAPAATVGMAGDAAFHIDLVADGPHALVAGTTGSGKSELLRTLVLALAFECPPDHLNFVLVDFKGGGAFDAVDQLPHVAGLITDLDETLVVRAVSSMRAELHRREQLFRKLGVSDYAQAAQRSNEPLARLVVVIDEFAVLAADYPELMASIIDLAARGRSLGMHLVLATQRPSGVVDQKIRANTNLRIALRVQDAHDSHDVIGVPDAASIDRGSPGRAIVSVGGDRPVSVQTAYSGGPDPRSNRCEVRPHALFVDPSSAGAVDDERSHQASQSELSIVLEAIVRACDGREAEVRPLWVDPLPTALDWIDLGSRVLSGDHGSDPFSITIGLVDLPTLQDQRPWRWCPESGALGIYGADGRATAKALVSIGAALASAFDPRELHLYVVDGDGGGTAVLQDLPHTGAYATLTEVDRVDRILGLFERALAERRGERVETPVPMVLLLDNLASVLSTRDDLAAAALTDRLAALARDGARQGLHLVITTRTVREMGHRLTQQIPNRLVMELADPASYLTLGLRTSEVVPLPSMRAIDLSSRNVVQLVEPPDVSTWTHELGDGIGLATPVGTFPMHLDRSVLTKARLDEDGTVVLPIGIEQQHLAEAHLSLDPGQHFLVIAGPGMGRSELCHTIATQLAVLDVDVYAVATASQRPASSSMSPAEVLSDPAAIDRANEGGRRGFIIVDDGHLLADDLAQALEGVIADRSTSLSVIAATTFAHCRGMRAWVREVRAAGCGLVLGGSPSDGDVLRVRPPAVEGIGVVPGRGYVVHRGQVTAVQVAGPAPNAP